MYLAQDMTRKGVLAAFAAVGLCEGCVLLNLTKESEKPTHCPKFQQLQKSAVKHGISDNTKSKKREVLASHRGVKPIYYCDDDDY